MVEEALRDADVAGRHVHVGVAQGLADLGPDPADAAVVLDGEHEAVGPGQLDQLRRDGRHPARVDHRHPDPLGGGPVGDLQTEPGHRADGHEQDVVAGGPSQHVDHTEPLERGHVLADGALGEAHGRRPVVHGERLPQLLAQGRPVTRRGQADARQELEQGQVPHAVVAGAVLAGDPGAVQHERHGQPVQRHVHQRLVERAVHERRVEAHDRVHAAHRQTGRGGDGVLFGDADVEGAVRVGLAESQQAHRLQHRGGDRDDVGALGADRDHLLGQHTGPAASAGVDRLARDGVGDRRDGVQAVGLIIDGRLVAVPLDGDRVHDDRTAEGLGPPQGRLHEGGVVAVDRPDVLQSEVLEQDLRLQEVLDPALEPVQRRVDRAADDGGPGQRCLHGVQGALVALRGAQPRQVDGQPADGRGVGPAVVVDHDDDRVVRRGDVVQGLPAHAAGQRSVADHGHDVPALAAQPVGLGQTVGVGQGRRGVAVLHEVVLGLGSARVAGQPALLA